jgi:hypothetical protein
VRPAPHDQLRVRAQPGESRLHAGHAIRLLSGLGDE